METLIAFIPLLGCAAMMLGCAAMMRGGHRTTTASESDEATRTEANASLPDGALGDRAVELASTADPDGSFT